MAPRRKLPNSMKFSPSPAVTFVSNSWRSYSKLSHTIDSKSPEYNMKPEADADFEVQPWSELMDQLLLVDPLFHARHCFFFWQNLSRGL